MFVLPNVNGLGKRNKKKPKRFNECLLMDGSMDFVDLGDETATERPQTVAKPTITFVAPAEVDRMRHARVSLPKIDAVKKLEPFCMIHSLYRCFCRGSATTGHPLELSDGESTTNVNPLASPKYYGSWEAAPSRKRQYTFEKEEPPRKRQYILEKGEPQASKNVALTNEQTIVHSEVTNLRYHDDIRESARTRPFRTRKAKSAHEWKMLRRKCVSDEASWRKLLWQRKQECADFREPPKRKNDLKQRSFSGVSAAPATSAKVTSPKATSAKVTSPKATSAAAAPAVRIPAATPSPSCSEMSVESDVQRKIQIEQLNQVMGSTMRSVKTVQLDTSFKLPNPFQRLLICKSWGNLLKAYHDQKIFIWVLGFSADRTILVITLVDEKPLIHDALFVAKLGDVDTKAMPLLGKMIKNSIESDKTKQLGKSTFSFIPSTAVKRIGCLLY